MYHNLHALNLSCDKSLEEFVIFEKYCKGKPVRHENSKMRKCFFDIYLDTLIYPNGYRGMVSKPPEMRLTDDRCAEFNQTLRSVSFNRSTLCLA